MNDFKVTHIVHTFIFVKIVIQSIICRAMVDIEDLEDRESTIKYFVKHFKQEFDSETVEYIVSRIEGSLNQDF